MKPLALLFVLLVAATRATAQEVAAAARDASQTPPGVVLLKLKWSRAVEFARGWERAGPFDAGAGTPDQSPLANRQRETARPVPNPLPEYGRLLYVYHYTAKIRNDGAKEIKGLIWDYVVSDPESKRVLGRHRFYSREKISEREQATLRGRSPAAPTRVVTAKGLEKDARAPFDERFEIKCVVYKDGTSWVHPSTGLRECPDPQRRRKGHKGRGVW